MRRLNKRNTKKVPKSLRLWFIIHFIVDISVAIPLFIAPEIVLSFFGWESIDPITTRLFAAALFGIGIESYLGRKSDIKTYSNMLNLKIIWSTFAILGLSLAAIQGLHSVSYLVWVGIIVFALFNILWIYWKICLNIIIKRG